MLKTDFSDYFDRKEELVLQERITRFYKGLKLLLEHSLVDGKNPRLSFPDIFPDHVTKGLLWQMNYRKPLDEGYTTDSLAVVLDKKKQEFRLNGKEYKMSEIDDLVNDMAEYIHNELSWCLPNEPLLSLEQLKL